MQSNIIIMEDTMLLEKSYMYFVALSSREAKMFKDWLTIVAVRLPKQDH